MIEELLEYAKTRLNEACKNDEPIETIRYWVGYLDALRAVERKEKGEVEGGA